MSSEFWEHNRFAHHIILCNSFDIQTWIEQLNPSIQSILRRIFHYPDQLPFLLSQMPWHILEHFLIIKQ